MHDIFEKIIAREIPAEIIYEDDSVIAFLDITPVNHGHTLVVPKKKFVNIFDADPVVLGRMMKVAKIVASTIQNELKADGVNLVMNNGEAAGQKVWHAHLHIIPRFQGDEAFQTDRHIPYVEGQMTEVAETLRTSLSTEV